MHTTVDIRICQKAYNGTLNQLFEQIKTKEVDILDINLFEVISGYHNHLKQGNSSPDLDKMSAFITMAGVLIVQKAKALFPDDGETEDEDEELNPPPLNPKARAERRNQLQKLSEKLYQKDILKRDVWGVPKTDCKETLYSKHPGEGTDFQKEDFKFSSPHQEIEKLPVLHLLQHYYLTLNKAKKRTSKTLRPALAPALPGLSECIGAINPHLKTGQSVKMSRLLQIIDPPQTSKEGNGTTWALSQNHALTRRLLVFLSLLELCRLSLVHLSQTQVFSDIDISVRKELSLENKIKLIESDNV